jgi:flagellar FliL protein
MAKDSPETEHVKPKKGKKILLIGLGSLVLLGGGAGAGVYYGDLLHPDKAGPVQDPNRPRLVLRSEEPEKAAEGEGADAKPAPRVGTVYVANDRVKVDPKKYQAGYFVLPESFTSNLSSGDGFIQIGLSVATYYDDRVFVNVKRHMVPIRSAILMVLSTQDEIVLSTPQGKVQLQLQLTKAINDVLRSKEGFGGIDNVYFSNLVIQ